MYCIVWITKIQKKHKKSEENNVSEAKLEEIVEKLSDLKVLELANLKTMLEDKWGVKAQAAVAAVAAAAPEKNSLVANGVCRW